MALSSAEFWSRLDRRNASQGRAKEIDAAIWEEAGTECAVLVTDMSGFTRVTKKHGILHFLALHRRSLLLSEAPIRKHGGELIKREADNLITLFEDVDSAVAAARDLRETLSRYNDPITDPDSRIRFCMGIGWGRILRLEDDAYGDAVNVAYKLGEDVALPEEILLSVPARERLRTLAGLTGPFKTMLGNLELSYFKL